MLSEYKTQKIILGNTIYLKKGPFGSALKKEMFVNQSTDTYKVYEQKNAIKKNHSLGNYYITQKQFEKLKGFELFGSDIIVSCAGTIGEIYELPEKIEKGIINQALMIVRVDEEIHNKKFIIELLYREIEKTSVAKSNGSAIKNIPPLSDLRNITYYNYPLLIQNQLGRLISTMDKMRSVV